MGVSALHRRGETGWRAREWEGWDGVTGAGGYVVGVGWIGGAVGGFRCGDRWGGGARGLDAEIGVGSSRCGDR